MILTQQPDALKCEFADALFLELKAQLLADLQAECPLHVLELGLWRRLLQLGFALLRGAVQQLGSGDLGPTVDLPDGRTVRRLPGLYDKRYVSIFGEVHVPRTAYGTREGQSIDFVPLDNRLQLPESDFSYVLQDWDQNLCVEQAFGKAASVIGRILDVGQHVDTLERMNKHMAQHVTDFRETRPMPDPHDEGEVMVLSADGKGVVMRGTDKPTKARRGKGDKASTKRMAIVGTAYTVDRYVRTPEQVVAALFREADSSPTPARPTPQHKHVWASLPTEHDGQHVPAVDVVYPWLLNEVAERNRHLTKPMVCLHDGQESLWEARAHHLPKANTTDILDVLHVTSRLWQAAHVFYKERSASAEAFARERILKVLQGKSVDVVRGLRQMGTKRKLTGAKKQTLRTICQYLAKNRERMRYAEYLAQGYPIASGVIEGACRHLVKDRLERAGMHWRIDGAQAMLDLRSTWINGDWEAYQSYYQRRETRRLYPYREVVQGVEFQMMV